MSVSSTEFMDVALFQNNLNLPWKTNHSDNRVYSCKLKAAKLSLYTLCNLYGSQTKQSVTEIGDFTETCVLERFLSSLWP